MVIHPSAIPSGSGVAISPLRSGPIMSVVIGQVYATPQCTG